MKVVTKEFLVGYHYKKTIDLLGNHIFASLIYDIPGWSCHNIPLSSKFSEKNFHHNSFYVAEHYQFHTCFVTPYAPQ
jgi:hypothetical protein